jgi:uncharacterized membrane protein YeaQ/YmgE (transglycosylase-associated protein family)
MEKFKSFIKEVQSKQVGLLMTFLMGILGLVMLSWLFGYWSNGLYGTHFEINSCWQGLAGIVTGLGGLATMAAKYYIDSKYNSNDGEKPERK